MRKYLVLSSLVLLACLGIAWSAPTATPAPAASVAPPAPTASLDIDQLLAAPGRVNRTSCTVTCPWNAAVTCTSQNGDCHLTYISKADVYEVTCDGHTQICEYY
jgi:hypothetical protein